MFRDTLQQARVGRALLAQVQQEERLWSSSGPTEEAVQQLKLNGANLSDCERIHLLAAWAFWDYSAALTVSDLVRVLDPRQMRVIAYLLIAAVSGATEVDEWLAIHEPDPGAGPSESERAPIEQN